MAAAAAATRTGRCSNDHSNDAVRSQLIQKRFNYRMAITYQRLNVLAQPRPLPHGFQSDRRSVYWIDKMPFAPGPDGITRFAGGKRLKKLSQPKLEVYKDFVDDREEPVWPVKKSAKNFTPSERLSSLAEPRYPPPEAWPSGYKFFRPPISEVPSAALKAKSTGRLEQLSAPIARKVHQGGDADQVARTVTAPSCNIPPAALHGSCSEYVQNLAVPKVVPKEYRPMNPVARPVTSEAQHAMATQRVQQLARPKSAKMKTDDFEPFHVSPFAKRAVPSPRVIELSVPLPRKVRSKT